MKPTKFANGTRNEQSDLRKARCDFHITRTHAHGSGQHSVEDYIQRLKLMVPNIRTDEKLDEFEILQRVIEYIQLLEDALGISVTPLTRSIHATKTDALH